MKVAVFFGAHADDIELGAGGTCAKLCAVGVEVHVVIGTDEASAAVAAGRRREAVAAAAALGVPEAHVHFLGFPDGGVRCNRETVGQVRAQLAQAGLRPDMVFTHTEADSHQDHVELTRIVRGSVRHAIILKYTVRNSAIVSHFNPCIYSAVDDFMTAKSAALCEHTSQVAVGRVDVDVLLNFAKRYSFNLDRRHFEPFELEVQEGVTGFLDLLDRVNDAPFSRLWQPFRVQSGVTVMAADRNGMRRPMLSLAPSDLKLVTRLQAEITRMMQGLAAERASDLLVVEEAADATLGDLPSGACVLLGGPAVNPLSRELFAKRSDLRLRLQATANQHGGFGVVDVETGRTFEPAYRATDDGLVSLTGDYGLLTITRWGRTDGPGSGSVLICAAGGHQAGLAAAFSCLTRMEHVARIVEEARAVIDGSAETAQWLIPCDGVGVPMLELVRSVVCKSRSSVVRAPAKVRRHARQQLRAAG